MNRRAQLVVVTLLLAAVAFTTTLTAGAANAHAARVSADPADHATVSTAPLRVSATFDEDLQTTFAAMTVVGPDGNMVGGRAGRARHGRQHRRASARADRQLHRQLPSDLRRRARGRRVVVVSADDTGTGTPGPAARPSDAPPDDVPVWPFALGAVALVGAGLWWSSRNKPCTTVDQPPWHDGFDSPVYPTRNFKSVPFCTSTLAAIPCRRS